MYAGTVRRIGAQTVLHEIPPLNDSLFPAETVGALFLHYTHSRISILSHPVVMTEKNTQILSTFPD
jgi:hypothetical protein